MENDLQKMFVEILESLKRLEASVGKLERGGQYTKRKDSGTVSTTGHKKASIKEFLIKLAPSNDVQMTLAIGYYMETNEGMQSFNTSDLTRGYRMAKEPIPKNINDKVNLSISKGHMMEAEEKKDNRKAWILTHTGEQYVENGLKEKASHQ